MSFWQAVGYFFIEAVTSLRRSWKVSSLAVATIAISLFTAGLFLLLVGNLQGSAEAWRREARVIVYLEPDADAAGRREASAAAAEPSWVGAVVEISAEEAADRFRRVFPSLGDLVEGRLERPLPASLEISLRGDAPQGVELAAWIASLRRLPQVSMVDDDRDWLDQLDRVIAVVGAVGVALAGVLLTAATLTIAAVIRLTTYLHREEIATLRLVGATEFFIRGPFYAEGLLQGVVGSLVATAALGGLHLWLRSGEAPSALVEGLVGSFLSLPALALLVILGAVAGLLGSVLSLRREHLGDLVSPPP